MFIPLRHLLLQQHPLTIEQGVFSSFWNLPNEILSKLFLGEWKSKQKFESCWLTRRLLYMEIARKRASSVSQNENWYGLASWWWCYCRSSCQNSELQNPPLRTQMKTSDLWTRTQRVLLLKSDRVIMQSPERGVIQLPNFLTTQTCKFLILCHQLQKQMLRVTHGFNSNIARVVGAARGPKNQLSSN